MWSTGEIKDLGREKTFAASVRLFLTMLVPASHPPSNLVNAASLEIVHSPLTAAARRPIQPKRKDLAMH